MPADNFDVVLASKSKGLKKIADIYGMDELKIFLADVIAELSQFMNIGKNMNPAQMLQTSELIIKKWPNIRMEDVKLCISNGKAGHYGKSYDRLDGQVILEWFDRYSIEKLEFIENRHYALKQDPGLDIFEDEKFMSVLRSLTTENPKVEESSRPIERNEAYTLANSWMKDFDKIHLQQFKGINQSVRFISVDGRNMDITEYMNYRLIQEQANKQFIQGESRR